jgi:hypothetical protein
MSKVILLDINVLMFRSIFNYERMLQQKIETKSNVLVMKPHYTCFIMILSALKKIGIEKNNTKVIVCQDGSSWRKKVYQPYKAQRKSDREKHTLINWNEQFENFNQLFNQLNDSTDWHFIRNWSAEADDLISSSCRLFKDDEIIIVSIDGDLKMLTYYTNVKYFTLMKKCNGSRGIYERIEKPLSILEKKSRCGDSADNVLVAENETEEDQLLRHQIVNLLELPNYVEEENIKLLSNLQEKELHLDKLPNFKNCKEKFLEIYNPKHKIDPEYCYKLAEKRIERKKKEKVKK